MQPAARLDDPWTATERDVPRRARLAGGGVVALAAVLVLATGLAALPRGVAAAADAREEPIDVALVELPEEPPPPEPPPPEPAAAPPAPGPSAPRILAPAEIPKDAPKETDAPAPEAGASGAPAPEGPAGGGGPGPAVPAAPATPPPAPPPPAPPAPKGPMRVTDDVDPPRPLSMASPAYPPAARAAGIEGTVVVSYVVSESGAVTDARVVRGPPELAEACLAAVRGWRFSPAQSAGRPVAVKRTARFPFRLRT